MNDYLKIGLDNCVPYELREYIYSKYGEQALADSDIGIDKAIESYLYWNKEGIQSDELLQKIASGDYSIEELEQFWELYVNTGFAKDVAVTKAAEEIFKGYEGNTLDEKIYEALRLKGLETDTDYAKIYGYLSADIQGSPYEGKIHRNSYIRLPCILY